MPNGITRTAKYLGSQGCVTLPVGKTSVNFAPVTVRSALGDASTQQWPMGNALPAEELPKEVNETKLRQAVKAAFEAPDALTERSWAS